MLFPRIGLMSRHQSNPQVIETLISIYHFLKTQNREVFIDENTVGQLPSDIKWPVLERKHLNTHCDLMIVVGGDGSLLEAARVVAPFDIPVLGINRGQLGFLTDILPSEAPVQILDILNGNYLEEKRFLIAGTVYHQEDLKTDTEQLALNDITLYSGHLSRLIEFEVSINNQFVYRQRSDGLIVSTPTGSTAYSLSGGGPILHPSLDAIVLVPMMPHTLTSRPIVVNNLSLIDIKIPKELGNQPDVSFDGQAARPLNPGDAIFIRPYPHLLRLIHPADYDYYQTLRTKLQWGSPLTTQ
jgi:NAD+ kinase